MTDNRKASFDAWYDSYDMRTPQDPFDKELARKAWNAAMQSPEIQALRKDAERMDWLDARAHCADWVEGEPTKRVIHAEDGQVYTGDTWREAIDAAMEKK